MLRQSINEQITIIQEYSFVKENAWWMVLGAIIAGLIAFFIIRARGKHSLLDVFYISLSYTLGFTLLTMFIIIYQSIEANTEMRQELNTRILHNVQENVAFDEIELLNTKYRGDVRVGTFQTVNDTGEYTEFQMAHHPEHDMMLPYGELSSEDIPVIPGSDLATVIE